MSPTIVLRSEWGATPWRSPTYHVDIEARDYFFNHYHGGTPRHNAGVEMAKEVEAIHLANGWAGTGYGFMIGMDGVAFEGRGWELVGAHCPNFNTRGMSVYYATGGTITDAAKETGRWFRDEHIRRRGKGVNTTVHGDHYPTACAGSFINNWVKEEGMWIPNTPAPAPIPPLPPTPAPIATPWRPSPKLSVDGKLGPNTTRALQNNLKRNHGFKALVVDGDIGPKTTTAVQQYLNKKLGGKDLVVDGRGFGDNLRESYGPTNTVRALQRWLASPVDGVLSYPSSLAVKRLQDRLNRGNF